MGKTVDILYDALTVIISIADITTDIIVLLSFYYQSRTTFFVLSLIILIIAHMAYSAVFILRYGIDYKWGVGWSVFIFFLSLPIASIFSFLFMFTEDPNSYFAKTFKHFTNLDVDDGFHTFFSSTTNRSEMAEWMMKKLAKHVGFIMEAALEALPQSLLQITAIVYYKEANYISIASIFLSMFSVMTKSLVLSQGIDIKTYIWTWLTIVVDFFGIFFTLTWVFYTNDTLLQPAFLGYFSIIGKIWCYKIAICILPVIAVGLGSWFTYFMPKFLCNIDYRDSCFTKFCWVLMIIVPGTIGVSLAVPIAFIGLEIFCFSFIAFGLYVFSTDRWRKYTNKNVNNTINAIIVFISNAGICNNGDRMVRILAVNYEYSKTLYYRKNELNLLIDRVEKERGIKGLKEIRYSDIRNNCGYREEEAKILPAIWKKIKNEAPDRMDYRDCLCCTGSSCESKLDDIFEYVMLFWCFMLICPVFVIGKLFQMIFPYVIVGYLLHCNHWNEIDLFQLVMLFTYIGLQIILFILGIIVGRIHYWLWHIEPGEKSISSTKINQSLIRNANDWYMSRAQIPLINKFILEMYGRDIGKIIMHYFHSIDLNAPEFKE